MIIILLIIIVVLIGIVIFQWKTKKEQNQTIQYMNEKLQGIVQEKSNEKILVTTSNSQIQQLLILINALLDHHQKI